METLIWLLDEVRPRAGTAAMLLAMAILRHGGGVSTGCFSEDGTPLRGRATGTLQTIADMARLSKSATEEAVKKLVERGFLEVGHGSSRNKPRTYSLLYADGEHPEFGRQPGELAPRGADFGHRPDSSRARANAGADDPLLISIPNEELITSSIKGTDLEKQILGALRAIRVDSIGGMTRAHSLDTLFGALKLLHEKMQNKHVVNPAGLLVALLKDISVFDPPEDTSFLAELCDQEAMRRARATKQWGLTGA